MTDNHKTPDDLTFDDIYTGQKAEFSHIVTETALENFINITNDFNPLHHDDDFADEAGFGRKIIPGMMTAAFLSRLIGMLLPGKNALYLSQDLKFIKPVYPGDRLTITGTVTGKETEKRDTIVILTEITNQDNNLVLTGTAKAAVRNRI
jgi:acyl dehydratase